MPQIGEAGQRKLLGSSVLIVGVGGLGSPAALYLAAAGVGRLGLVDADTVSLSNLQRQVLYSHHEIGQPKVFCAKERLQSLSPSTSIDCYQTYLTPQNAEEIVSQYDIVVDGCDNYATRYLMDDTCTRLGKPYVYGAIGAFKGQVSVFNYKGSKHYIDLYPDKTYLTSLPKIEMGVLGTIPGIIGSLQATEVIKIITSCGEVLSNKLYTIDLLSMESNLIEY